MDISKIGKFISELRKEKNLTQKDLATKLNVTDKAISRWETGKGMPDTSLWQKICETLNISVNEMLNGERIDKAIFVEKSNQTIVDIIAKTKKQAKIKFIYLSITSVIIVIAASILLILNNNNSYYNEYYSANIGNKQIQIPLPKYSFFTKQSGMYGAQFKTLKDHDEVTLQIKQYLLTLEKININNKTVYYDKLRDITIENYSFSNQGPWVINTIYLTFTLGRPT